MIAFVVVVVVAAAAEAAEAAAAAAAAVAVACSGVTIDMFVEALVMIAVVTGIGVNVLVDANTDVLAGTMTASEFANSEPFKDFDC